jgi:hypothetical protein
MSNDPLERELGRPLRPSLPPSRPDFDDEPLTKTLRPAERTPEHWPDEEATLEPSMDFSVTEGEVLKTLEYYFPLFWLACLVIVSYIGVYYAVDQLEGTNPIPPAWF